MEQCFVEAPEERPGRASYGCNAPLAQSVSLAAVVGNALVVSAVTVSPSVAAVGPVVASVDSVGVGGAHSDDCEPEQPQDGHRRDQERGEFVDDRPEQ